MATDIVADIARLVGERDELSNRLETINAQLQRIEMAIGGVRIDPPRKGERRPRTRVRIDGGVSKAILEELGRQQPQRIQHLSSRMSTGMHMIGPAAKKMADAGVLFRRMDVRGMRGGGYWYATDVKAFDGHPDIKSESEQQPAEASDELG